ncbi:SEL1-like repeat protein [Candidatus Epulonipiscium viviparus]
MKAQASVGACYANGFGTEKNMELAAKWFKKSSRARLIEQ